MIFRATYDDEGAPVDVQVDVFDLEHTWGVAEIDEAKGIHLKATDKRVTVTAGGYVATYEIVKRTKHEVETRLLGIRRVKE
jgi:hypothetical protein